jgi:molecular chaperone DnaK
MTPPPSNEPKRVPLRIRLPFATEAEFIERYGMHVAPGALFIATRQPKPLGTLLSFELVLAEGARLMRGEGIVHSVSEDQRAGRAGMLVRLTRVDAKTKALIDQISALQELVAQQPSATPPAPPPVIPAAAPPQPAGPVPLAEDVVLGLDFGTTTCRAAVFINGKATLVPIPSEGGAPTMPSVIAYDSAQPRLLVGSAAQARRSTRPLDTLVGFKRLLGRRARSPKVHAMMAQFSFAIASDPEGDVGIELGARVHSLPELAAELLSEMKRAAQAQLGRPLTRAVLCVPAWYTDHQRSAVLDAARRAGLEVLSMLNEPSAVALAFGYGKGLARKRVLVYDLGGGTFDASVVEITGDDLEVVSTGGDDFLGGLDFDARLVDAVVKTLPEAVRTRLTPESLERLRDAAEQAKICLSLEPTAPLRLPNLVTNEDGTPYELNTMIERSLLEAVTTDLVERTVHVTQVVLEAAGLQPQSLDELLLVGGQSRSPAVRRRLEQVLGRAARSDVDPQGAVALGAALYGQSLVQRERGKRGLSLSEVLAAPIGVAVKGGGFRRVLERNTRLPAEKTLAVPVLAGVPVAVAVLQGTSPRADENEYLGVLKAETDRPGELQLRFTVAADGRLALSAVGPMGKPEVVTFTTQQGSDDAQAKLLADAPLSDEAEKSSQSKGLLGGLKRLFGR